MPPTFPLLTTARLQLREIAAADAENMFLIHSDAATMRWFGVDALTTRAQADQIIAVFASWFVTGSGVRWGIARQDDDQLIGTCGLFQWNKSWHSGVIGFELARALQRRGYMIEALHAILDYGFLKMGLHRIQAECHADNLGSIALLARLGFQFEGVHRQYGYWGNRFHDLNCYSLLRHEWQKS